VVVPELHQLTLYEPVVDLLEESSTQVVTFDWDSEALSLQPWLVGKEASARDLVRVSKHQDNYD
jgi:hypothetical protein